MFGVSPTTTIRLLGKIKNQQVIIPVDSRSRNNFLDILVAQKLGCNVQHIPDIPVTLANGDTLAVQGICKQLQWEVQD